jgi:hypothetical protein
MSLVTDLLQRVVVILLALVTVLLGWLIAFPDELALAAPTHAEFTYTCDSQHNAAVATTATERGPPATYDRATTYDAVGLWPRGTSACSDVPTLRTATTHDDPTRFVQVAQATGTTPEPVRHLDGALLAFARSGVAAKTPIGFAEGLGQSALTPGRMQHGTKNLTKAGVLPAWSGKNSPGIIERAFVPILEHPTATFDHTLGGTQVRGFLGAIDGNHVAVFVYKEGPYQGQLASSFVPSANQLKMWGVP